MYGKIKKNKFILIYTIKVIIKKNFCLNKNSKRHFSNDFSWRIVRRIIFLKKILNDLLFILFEFSGFDIQREI